MYFTKELLQSNKYLAALTKNDDDATQVAYAYWPDSKLQETSSTSWEKLVYELEEVLKNS